MPNFTVLLMGCPSLAGPLRAAGAVVLSSGEGPPDQPVRPGCVTILARPTRATAAYAQAQAAQGQAVVLLAGPDDPTAAQAPPGIAVLHLPAAIDGLLDLVGAKTIGGVVGSAEIGEDLAVRPTRARDGLGLFQKVEAHVGAPASGPGAPRADDGLAPASPVQSSPVPESPVPDSPMPDSLSAASTDRRGPIPLDLSQRPITPQGFEGQVPAWAPAPERRPPGLVDVFDEPAPQGFEAPTPAPAPVRQQPEPVDIYAEPAPQPPLDGASYQAPEPGLAGFDRQAPAPRPRGAKVGALLICFAGKGGVGKSTMALSLGELASSLGLRAVVVDANRGQGDLRKYLRVNQAYLPSVVDAAASGDPMRAITTPERLAAARPAGLPVPSFATVLAPTDSQVDPSLVTPAVYREVLAAVREIADIVIVDTQIVEAADVGGMVDNFMIPELMGGAWGLGISDPSVGADNLLRRLYMFAARHIGPERLMIALNRVEPSSGLNQEAMARLVQPYATWMGSVGMDPSVVTAFESGAVPSSPELDELLGRVLGRVTGIAPAPVAPREQERPRRRFFRRG